MSEETLTKYIVIDSNIRFGKPCIKGTRITVGDILQWLSEGMSVGEMLNDFPELQEVHNSFGILTIIKSTEINLKD